MEENLATHEEKGSRNHHPVTTTQVSPPAAPPSGGNKRAKSLYRESNKEETTLPETALPVVAVSKEFWEDERVVSSGGRRTRPEEDSEQEAEDGSCTKLAAACALAAKKPSLDELIDQWGLDPSVVVAQVVDADDLGLAQQQQSPYPVRAVPVHVTTMDVGLLDLTGSIPRSLPKEGELKFSTRRSAVGHHSHVPWIPNGSTDRSYHAPTPTNLHSAQKPPPVKKRPSYSRHDVSAAALWRKQRQLQRVEESLIKAGARVKKIERARAVAETDLNAARAQNSIEQQRSIQTQTKLNQQADMWETRAGFLRDSLSRIHQQLHTAQSSQQNIERVPVATIESEAR
jgi:hypothetical protein